MYGCHLYTLNSGDTACSETFLLLRALFASSLKAGARAAAAAGAGTRAAAGVGRGRGRGGTGSRVGAGKGAGARTVLHSRISVDRTFVGCAVISLWRIRVSSLQSHF